MRKEFDQSWKEWIDVNISKGCCVKGMYDILLDHGFDEIESAQRLGIDLGAQQATRVVKDEVEADDSRSFLGELVPNSTDLSSDQAEICTVGNFLNEMECLQLIEVVRNNLRKSTTTNDVGKYANHRTSSTCDLGLLNEDIVTEIDSRICKLIGLDNAESEPLQGQWYEVGQEFKAHTDYFEVGTEEFREHAEERGQRTWTVMIYLNSTRAGGETDFPVLDISFKPIAGTVVIWNNLFKDGEPNPATLHHGKPVISGYKVILTKWFRARESSVVPAKEKNEYLRPMTRTGFQKHKIPTDLFKEIQQYYFDNMDKSVDESVPGFIHAEGSAVPSVVIDLPVELKNKVHSELKPLIENWAGDYLIPTYVYGIREYRRGSRLDSHRDRLETHLASAILNIDQQVEHPWPLHIDDHQYRNHEIMLEPGEMVMYEGAKLKHGRPTVFCGSRYANVFVHYGIA